MAEKFKVLICGSGIAGSSLAYWLLRAHPTISITILERSPAPRLTGAAVDIRNSAVDVIKMMNMEAEIRANGTREKGACIKDSRDRTVVTIASTGREDVQNFTSEYEIMRGTLAKVFITPSLDKINMVFDEYVKDFREVGDKVHVSFNNGKQDETYDIMVAADGIGSFTRSKLLGKPAREQIWDYGIHTCYFTAKTDFLKGSLIAQAYFAPEGRVIFVRPDPHPDGHCSVILINVTTPSQIEKKGLFNNAIKEGNEAYKSLVHEQWKGAGWICEDLLQHMDDSDDFYCSLFASARSPILQDGRVVLLGDAGYATPGFGTSLAIMGSYVLAGELLNTKFEDVKTATRNYESFMQPIAQQTHTKSTLGARIMGPQSSWAIYIRNLIIKVLVALKVDRIATFVSAGLNLGDKKIVLPTYRWPA